MLSMILENEAIKENFDTLFKAAEQGQLCLMDCIDKRTNEHVPVICVVSKVDNKGEDDIEMLPFGLLFTNNPYEFLIPPSVYAQKEINNGQEEINFGI